MKYKKIRQAQLVYLPFIVKLATCFDGAGSSSVLYVNQVMLKDCLHLWDPIDVYKRYIYIYIKWFVCKTCNILKFHTIKTHIMDVLKMYINL
jgi:hypothetical protein